MADIKAVSKDAEAAHAREDALYEDVLRAIHNLSKTVTRGRAPSRAACDEMGRLARAALRSKDIEFGRYCA